MVACVLACLIAPPSVAHSQGLVAAYNFNEGQGSFVGDQSGSGNTGTVTGAVWTSAGRFGNALEFDGTSSLVTVPDAPSLQLSTALTLEAWVYPTALPSAWTDVIYKWSDDYYLEATSAPGGLPAMGGSFTSPLQGSAPLQSGVWSHLAATYDGAMQRLYVNGVQVASAAQTGGLANSGGPLSIGGDGLYGQHFAGRIDEVRVYDRALAPAEIQSDMATPIDAPPDTTPPTVSIAPLGSSTVGGVVQVEIIASDDVGIAGVELFLDGGSIGSDANPPYLVKWNTTTSGNGPHTLTATASDLGGNQSLSDPVAVVTDNPAFSNEVVVPGITAATTIQFLPNGHLLVGELTETIWVVQPGASAPDPTPFLQLDGSALVGEQGLMDITLDPAFATNGFYYVFYTHASATAGNFDRVSRFTAGGDATVPGSEFLVWQDAVTAHQEHHGGAIAFGPDGRLYITVGDHFNAQDAQNLSSYHGKILRLNPDGSVPADNPFVDGAGPNRDEIWALGLRNPFRMSFDPLTGRMFIGDVGGNDPSVAWEEVNVGVAGANYGWPLCEGSCGSPGTTGPIYAYPHLGRDASITGGFVYRGGQFPSAYDGSYFFADYVQNWIKRLTFDAAGNLLGVVEFEPPDGAADGPYGDPVKLVQGLDGAIYYVDIGFNDQHVPNEAAIRRIRHLVGDQPPVAVAGADPLTGLAPLLVSFSSAGSADPEGMPLSYAWDFGDGATSTAANPTHTYTSNGRYVARLTVSDGSSSALSSDIVITVGTPPSVAILTPADSSLFVAGDVIEYSGAATDGTGAPLPPGAFTWTIVFHHDSHVHPAGGPFTGSTAGSFTIPSSGHDFTGNTSYEFILSVMDADGLTAAASVTVFPDKVDLGFQTVPPGLALEVDGVRKVTPFVLDTLKGFQHTINAPAQVFGGLAYDFASWSDGGAQSHVITVPTSPANWVATFATAPGGVGLVAAYSFSEGLGSIVGDQSGSGNTGAVTGAVWTSAGRFGNALEFDGAGSMVSVPDAPSLRLSTALTLEAWVYPTALPSAWTDVIYKWNDDYYLEATSLPAGLPATGGSYTTPLRGPAVLVANDWSHLAATYDGAMQRLYVNGVEVASAAQTGGLANSGGPLSIGGDGLYGQHFAGRIDEVRVYNRALTPAEIQNDMAAPVPTAVEGDATARLGSSALVGAAPNPFNPGTTIRFRLASAEDARLDIYNLAGRLVRSFSMPQPTPGEHELFWRGDDAAGRRVASGVYLVRLDTPQGGDTIRITLLK